MSNCRCCNGDCPPDYFVEDGNRFCSEECLFAYHAELEHQDRLAHEQAEAAQEDRFMDKKRGID